jgi:hypothetical protein
VSEVIPASQQNQTFCLQLGGHNANYYQQRANIRWAREEGDFGDAIHNKIDDTIRKPFEQIRIIQCGIDDPKGV